MSAVGGARRAAGLLSLLFLHVLAPGQALGGGEREGFSPDLGGSFRTVAGLLDNYDEPRIFGEGNDFDGLSVNVLRLTAEDDRRPFGSFEAHLVLDMLYTSAPSGTGAAGPTYIAGGAARYRALDLSRELIEEDELSVNLYIDRLNAGGSWGKADATLGRQAINFSQAYFWNPLDIFLPFDPEAFDRSYKPGVDALRGDFAIGPFAGLTLVAAAGNVLRVVPAAGGFRVEKEDFADEPWEGSALLGRGRATLNHWDVTLQGGKVSGGLQIGGGFSGEAGPLGVRGEATYLFAGDGDTILLPDPGAGGSLQPVPLVDDHAMVVVGADHLFESSLYINAEYFYNGAGEADDLKQALPRVAVGETTNLGEHYLGLQTSYDLHPLLVGQVAWIHSFTDGSDLVTPTFRWSVADEAACIFGAILGFGDRPGTDPETGLPEIRSEFGSSPNLYFTELIFYF